MKELITYEVAVEDVCFDRTNNTQIKLYRVESHLSLDEVAIEMFKFGFTRFTWGQRSWNFRPNCIKGVRELNKSKQPIREIIKENRSYKGISAENLINSIREVDDTTSHIKGRLLKGIQPAFREPKRTNWL